MSSRCSFYQQILQIFLGIKKISSIHRLPHMKPRVICLASNTFTANKCFEWFELLTYLAKLNNLIINWCQLIRNAYSLHRNIINNNSVGKTGEFRIYNNELAIKRKNSFNLLPMNMWNAFECVRCSKKQGFSARPVWYSFHSKSRIHF